MEYQAAGNSYVVSIARSEEIITSIKKFCADTNTKLAEITGIGAAEDIELGYYNVDTREYLTKKFPEQHEITALVGSITTMNGEPYIHLHATLGDKNFQAHAGHLIRATVSGACEIIINTLPGTVERYHDEAATGLNLLKIDEGHS